MASEVEATDHHPPPAKDGPLSGANGHSSPATPTPNAPENNNGASSSSPPTASLEPTTSHPNNAAVTNSDVGITNDQSDPFETSSSSRVLSPITSPPYWMTNHNTTPHSSSQNGGHIRQLSAESVLPPGAITLQDNESSVLQAHDRNAACWARSVEVTNFIVINGSTTNIGAFVVWNIKVETLSGSFMNIRKRYSEFDDFRRRLIQTFPNFEAAVPALPPKSVIGKFRPRFLEKRRAGLQYFLNCILLNPEFSGSPVLKDFLFN